MPSYRGQMLSTGDLDRVAACYELGRVVGFTSTTGRGEQGRVHRLDTELGSFAVKEKVRAETGADVAGAAAFQHAARGAGVITPDVLRTVDGRVLLDLPAAQVRVYEWVDLAAPDAGLAPELLGPVLAALHRIPFTGTDPEHPWYYTAVGGDRWVELHRALTRAGAPFAADLGGLLDDLREVEALIRRPTTVRTCHRDLFADNLRRRADGRLCVIDWENAGLGSPTQELAGCLIEYGLDDPDRIRRLHGCYVAAGGPARVRESTDFTMAIAQLGHLTARACACWLESSGDAAEQTRMTARFAEYADRPLTVTAIAATLEAIG